GPRAVFCVSRSVVEKPLAKGADLAVLGDLHARRRRHGVEQHWRLSHQSRKLQPSKARVFGGSGHRSKVPPAPSEPGENRDRRRRPAGSRTPTRRRKVSWL